MSSASCAAKRGARAGRRAQPSVSARSLVSVRGHAGDADPLVIRAMVKRRRTSSTLTRRTTRSTLKWALKLSRQGSLIIADNVVRDGAVVDGSSDDPRVQGIRRCY